jgi:hypothetical protein
VHIVLQLLLKGKAFTIVVGVSKYPLGQG